MAKSSHIWGWVLLFVSFVWGIEFALVHQALDSLGPNTFNGLRFFLAIVTLCVYCLISRQRLSPHINRATLHHGIVLGLLLFAGFATQSVGLQYTSASNGGFITGLNVVLVPVTAWLWLKHPQHWYVWLGVAMATLGTLLLTGGINGFGRGELWVLCCAFAFAIHIVYTGVYARTVNPLALTQIQFITVTLLSAVAACIWETDSMSNVMPVLLGDHPASVTAWVAILVGGILGTSLAYVAQTIGQQTIAAWRVALIFATEPLFAALGGYWLLDEVLTTMAWLGALLIITSMLVAELADDDD